jgi:hypothetical protein
MSFDFREEIDFFPKDKNIAGLHSPTPRMSRKITINDFPNELVFAVFDWLPPTHLYFARQVCRLWHEFHQVIRGARPICRGDFIGQLIRDDCLELLKLLPTTIFNPNRLWLGAALFHDQIRIAQWLIGEKGVEPNNLTVSTAIRGGHRQAIKCALAHHRYGYGGIDLTADSVAILKFIDTIVGCEKFSRKQTLSYAVHRGNCEVVEWAIKNIGCKCSMSLTSACETAAARGSPDDIKIFELLKSHGVTRLGNNLVERAASNKRYDMITWLLANGYGWGSTCRHFLANGLEFTTWCLDRGCSYNLPALFSAKSDEIDECVYEYFEQFHDLSQIKQNGNYTNSALLEGKIKRFLFLEDRGFARRGPAYQNYPSSSTKLLVERGELAWRPQYILQALQYRDLGFVEWARRTGREMPESKNFRFYSPYIRHWYEQLLQEPVVADA